MFPHRTVKSLAEALFTAAALFASGEALKWMVNLALRGNPQYIDIVEFVLNVSATGMAILVAVFGFLVAAWEQLCATSRNLRGR